MWDRSGFRDKLRFDRQQYTEERKTREVKSMAARAQNEAAAEPENSPNANSPQAMTQSILELPLSVHIDPLSGEKITVTFESLLTEKHEDRDIPGEQKLARRAKELLDTFQKIAAHQKDDGTITLSNTEKHIISDALCTIEGMIKSQEDVITGISELAENPPKTMLYQENPDGTIDEIETDECDQYIANEYKSEADIADKLATEIVPAISRLAARLDIALIQPQTSDRTIDL